MGHHPLVIWRKKKGYQNLTNVYRNSYYQIFITFYELSKLRLLVVLFRYFLLSYILIKLLLTFLILKFHSLSEKLWILRSRYSFEIFFEFIWQIPIFFNKFFFSSIFFFHPISTKFLFSDINVFNNIIKSMLYIHKNDL